MLYIYDGPVVMFGKCICNKWHGETMAMTKRKAKSNLEYQFKKQQKLAAGAKVSLPGVLKEKQTEVDYGYE